MDAASQELRQSWRPVVVAWGFLVGMFCAGAALIGPPLVETAEVGPRLYLAGTGVALSLAVAAILRWLHRRLFHRD